MGSALTCGDCGKRRDRCIPISDPPLVVVCPQCWRDYEYAEFFREGPEAPARLRRELAPKPAPRGQ